MAASEYGKWIKVAIDLGLGGDELKMFVKERQEEAKLEKARADEAEREARKMELEGKRLLAEANWNLKRRSKLLNEKPNLGGLRLQQNRKPRNWNSKRKSKWQNKKPRNWNSKRKSKLPNEKPNLGGLRQNRKPRNWNLKRKSKLQNRE